MAGEYSTFGTAPHDVETPRLSRRAVAGLLVAAPAVLLLAANLSAAPASKPRSVPPHHATLGGNPSTCPGLLQGTPPSSHEGVPPLEVYNAELKTLDIPSVVRDIIVLLNDSQPCWPADSFEGSKVGHSYGGLFIRLAWHCSGTYRKSDGVGGCSGGRQRFEPEASWPDNTNLDKARALLWPIKQKYGAGLSWGDLFVLAGTTSILHYGGPVSEVCVGRIDDPDGAKSAPLGPGPEQPPCPFQGDCQLPLGTSTVGLIYVNPQGYMGIPDQMHSALQVREVFGRMGWNDTEIVALIGGGHTFGKAHGACTKGAGPSPKDSPHNPWPGLCGTGRGKDTFSSGIEGHWTTDPFRWDNEYFRLLTEYGSDYTLEKGPGGAWQWKLAARPGLMMMTTDLSLHADPTFRGIVREWAADITLFNTAFAAAWEKLVTHGTTWAGEKKCWTPDASFVYPGL
eukprot:Hpha_TRINITY_DN15997_c10_g10::TRINITY_DN15997_c10_g10_i1::g.70346::m.70346/K03782/katG; catalase-peroxidase